MMKKKNRMMKKKKTTMTAISWIHTGEQLGREGRTYPTPTMPTMPTNNYYDPATGKVPIAMAMACEPEPMSVPHFAGTPSEIPESILKRLMGQGFTHSLARSLNETKRAFALRIWVIDNSGSMQKADGHRIIDNGKSDVFMVDCSRWEEIRECVEYHIQLADLIDAPTRFRFLNDPGTMVGPQKFAIKDGSHAHQLEAHEALSLMRRARPSGCTPLTQHIMEIYTEIFEMVPELRRTGQRVAIILATDGLPTDERGYGGAAHQNDFVDKLRLLEGLPVWVVIRLCTDDDEVVNFYNELDNMLELSIEVLDDFSGEAQEVFEANPWLNYALPLHRMREMGYHDRMFDLIDNRLLTRSEIGDFCALLFGRENFDGVPDPSVDWAAFVKELDRFLKREKKQWSPITKKMQGWVNQNYLKRVHDGSPTCTCTIL